jgi:hypothetical protein
VDGGVAGLDPADLRALMYLQRELVGACLAMAVVVARLPSIGN